MAGKTELKHVSQHRRTILIVSTVMAGVALGLFYQQSWVRGAKRRRETWRQRIKRPRQSQCWTAAGSQWIFMADREADFYEPIEHGQPGWHTIWRGWQRLMWMCRGLESLQSTTI